MQCSVLSVNSSWFGVGAFVAFASREPILNLRRNTAWLKPMPLPNIARLIPIPRQH